MAISSGKWSLTDKEFPANIGEILYVELWVCHGLTNTGTGPLAFIVVRFKAKGTENPSRSDNRPDEL